MKRIVILGAGESGAGAAVLAKKEGFDVFVSDMSKIADKYKKMLDDRHIEWEEGQHTESKITVRFWITTIILAALTIITLKMR